eukprot:1165054-Rhodomonas_salina.1
MLLSSVYARATRSHGTELAYGAQAQSIEAKKMTVKLRLNPGTGEPGSYCLLPLFCPPLCPTAVVRFCPPLCPTAVQTLTAVAPYAPSGPHSGVPALLCTAAEHHSLGYA